MLYMTNLLHHSQMGQGVLKFFGQKYPGSLNLNFFSSFSIFSMYSSAKENPNSCKFSLILPSCSDLGMTAQPLCRPHLSTTYNQPSPASLNTNHQPVQVSLPTSGQYSAPLYHSQQQHHQTPA